jgi:hypothetical protein
MKVFVLFIQLRLRIIEVWKPVRANEPACTMAEMRIANAVMRIVMVCFSTVFNSSKETTPSLSAQNAGMKLRKFWT